MDEAVEWRVGDVGEGAEFGDAADSRFELFAEWGARHEFCPRIALELLDAEACAVALGVDGEHDGVGGSADGEAFGEVDGGVVP